MKTVTVCILTRNRVFKFIRALWSIKNQEITPDSVLISDNSPKVIYYIKKVLSKLILGNKVLIFHDNPEYKLGLLRDNLLDKITTDFFTWLDDDDSLHPLFLKIFYDTLEEYPLMQIFASHGASECEIHESNKVYSNLSKLKLNPKTSLVPVYNQYSSHKYTKVYADNGCKVFKSCLYHSLRHELRYKLNVHEDFIPVISMICKANIIVRNHSILYKVGRGSRSLTKEVNEHNLNTISDELLKSKAYELCPITFRRYYELLLDFYTTKGVNTHNNKYVKQVLNQLN